MTHKKTDEGYRIFRSYLEEENDKPYYSTNTLSFYYEDMERKQKLIEDLAKAIAGYDQTLTGNLQAIEEQVAERFEQWDEKLKTFDGSVMDLLREWVDDGTMDHIVDSSIVDRKLEPITAQLAETLEEIDGIKEVGLVRLKAAEYTDISAQVNELSDYLVTNYGGGKILYPKGIFYGEGMKLVDGVWHEGLGSSATRIRLPLAPKTDMFVTDVAVLNSGGISKMELDGVTDDFLYNGIDLGNCIRAENYHIADMYIRKFKRGYNGSQNDRRVVMNDCRIWNNFMGVYVTMNHPHFGTNDFRSNVWAITGIILYDIAITNCRFVRNDYGIVPQEGGSFSGSHLSNNLFFSNNIKSLSLNNHMAVDNCLFVPSEKAGATDIGIEIKGTYVSIINNQFRPEIAKSFGDCAIAINAAVGSYLTIDNNTFRVNGTVIKNVGTGVRESISIDGNKGNITGKFVDFPAGSADFNYSSISNNNLFIGGTTNIGTDAVIYIDKTLGGFLATNNTIFAAPAAILGEAIKGDFRSSIITHNRIRRTTGITATTSDASTINEKNIVS